MFSFIHLAAVALAAASIAPAQGQTPAANPFADLDKYIYPLAPEIPCPPVTTDTTDAPEVQPWADKAKALVTEWFPKVCQLLATEGWKPPKEVHLVFKRDIGPPAYTVGHTITIKVPWITAHPDDFGMVIHELTHVIQNYPNGADRPGWLVEGMADYVRWWRYEPEGPHPKITERNKYTDSYRVTAEFLAWCQHHENYHLVTELDRAMRHGEDPMPVFQKVTGKDVDALWSEFEAAQK